MYNNSYIQPSIATLNLLHHPKKNTIFLQYDMKEKTVTFEQFNSDSFKLISLEDRILQKSYQVWKSLLLIVKLIWTMIMSKNHSDSCSFVVATPDQCILKFSSLSSSVQDDALKIHCHSAVLPFLLPDESQTLDLATGSQYQNCRKRSGLCYFLSDNMILMQMLLMVSNWC